MYLSMKTFHIWNWYTNGTEHGKNALKRDGMKMRNYIRTVVVIIKKVILEEENLIKTKCTCSTKYTYLWCILLFFVSYDMTFLCTLQDWFDDVMI